MFTQQLFANDVQIVKNKPQDFVNLQEAIPTIQVDMKYYSDDNFAGRAIKGYHSPICLLTEKAALALREVQNQLITRGLSLIVYDCYRPQTSVNDFIEWSKDSRDVKLKTKYYPNIEKFDLFKEGYIAHHSGHSRGSTVDLSIVSIHHQLSNSKVFKDDLDFGSEFDFFDPTSHINYQAISSQAKANRLLLQTLMAHAGFKPFKMEWWHFTLKEEPYPDTYFDFPVT